jgi:hypothetical protein
MHKLTLSALFALLMTLSVSAGLAQPMTADAKVGLSVLSGGGSSTSLLFGGALDIPFQENLYFRPELDITLHDGTPIEIAALLKYDLPSTTASMPLFVDGGLGFWFYSGGSSLGLDFGGGTYFSANEGKMKIPLEVRMGPIFNSGSASFQFSLSTGIRFSIGGNAK